MVLIGAMCFAACQSLAAIAFEEEYELRRIESQAFAGTAITSVMLPETIQSLSADAFPWTCEIVIQNHDGAHAFAEWDAARRAVPVGSFDKSFEWLTCDV
jgi:hypothetical protein